MPALTAALTLVAALWWSGCGLGRPPAAMDGTYLRAFDEAGRPMRLAEPVEWQRYPATECLHLERRDRHALFFDLTVNQASGHSCSAAGIATRRRGAEFEAELETLPGEPPCRVRLQFSPDGVLAEGLNRECRFYCGVGAILEARFGPGDELASSVACQVSPVPDLEELERAAERGLKQRKDGETTP